MSRKAEKKSRRSPSLLVTIFLSVLGGLVVLSFLAVLFLRNSWIPIVATAETDLIAAPEAAQAVALPETTDTVDLASDGPGDSEITVSQYSTLKLGDDNAAVEALQAQLMTLGYLDYDMPSTRFNSSLAEAVRLFQRSIDREQTGVADAALQELLYLPNAQTYQLKLADSGSDVENLQYRLTEMGYYTDKISGFFGPNTETAVMVFQASNGMGVSGRVNHSDWELIYSDEAVESTSKVTPTPSPAPVTPRPTRTPAPTKKPSSTPKPGTTAKPTATPKPETTQRPPSGDDSKSYAKSVSGLIACANDQLGKPYEWAKRGPDSFDCSGLVYYCLTKAGVKVSRLSSRSYSENSSWTLISEQSDLKTGDLLFFCNDSSPTVSHTGIYIGGNKFIHASSSQGKVMTSSFSAYWVRNFVCGRRVF
ncbi:MAG: peptidoglycan-binding protein [Clostridiales bacterium]|nr:peptidoglycan-binding protein [Clostridiales bacterium]